jgi:hypothetical protein
VVVRNNPKVRGVSLVNGEGEWSLCWKEGSSRQGRPEPGSFQDGVRAWEG